MHSPIYIARKITEIIDFSLETHSRQDALDKILEVQYVQIGLYNDLMS